MTREAIAHQQRIRRNKPHTHEGVSPVVGIEAWEKLYLSLMIPEIALEAIMLCAPEAHMQKYVIEDIERYLERKNATLTENQWLAMAAFHLEMLEFNCSYTGIETDMAYAIFTDTDLNDPKFADDITRSLQTCHDRYGGELNRTSRKRSFDSFKAKNKPSNGVDIYKTS